MYRCRHDIINDMLSALMAEPRRITELCSIGNVPVDRGKDIVKYMEKFGILFETTENGEKEYRLTDRGYEWIGLFKHLKKALP